MLGSKILYIYIYFTYVGIYIRGFLFLCFRTTIVLSDGIRIF